MRVGICARVSNADKGQDPENHLMELRTWCANSGHEIAREYVEHESGKKGTDRRKQFAALFSDAAKRKFDLVLFWSLDRFSREGMTQTIGYLRRLTSYSVSFHSYSEPHLATDNELYILLALLSSLAKVEAQKISERTKAGMARAKAKGSRIGRPKPSFDLRRQIAKRAAEAQTAYVSGKAIRVDRRTAAKYALGAEDD
jgi:DNA invertase Pin-like site-specific DNA recombinase